MNRLVSGNTKDNEYVYYYDAAGNRSRADAEISSGDSYNTYYTYDKNNRLLKEEKIYGVDREYTDYYYDKNGNQLTKVRGTDNIYGFSEGIVVF